MTDDVFKKLEQFLKEGSADATLQVTSSTPPKDIVPVSEFVKHPVKEVKQIVKENVKDKLTDEAILKHIDNGRRPVDIAALHNCSRANISYFFNKLKSKGFIVKQDNKWIVKENVKDLLLSSTDKKKYQFQTIQVIVPIKNPDQFDMIKWDRYLPSMRQYFKKYKDLKFTLNRTTKSIRLWLHSRYVEKPEDVKKICRKYVEYVKTMLKEYDIEIDESKTTAKGLHLWGKDGEVKDNYSKDMGVIGVYHGIKSENIFKGDEPKERKTWVDSSPHPEGIESNDTGFFKDKTTLEEYMKVPTLFMSLLKTNNERMEVYNQNLTTHMDLVEILKEQAEKQTQILEEFKNLSVQERRVKEAEMRIDKPSRFNLILCRHCKAEFSERLEYCPKCQREVGINRFL